MSADGTFGIIEGAIELWLEYRPLKDFHPFRKMRNRRRARLGLPLLPTDDAPEEGSPMPTGTVTKTGILVMVAAAVLAPLLTHFGLPATCPVDAPNCLTANSLATMLLTTGVGLGGAVIAWWGKNRGLTREALLKQALVDLLGHEATVAVQKGATVQELIGPTATAELAQASQQSVAGGLTGGNPNQP